MVGIVLKQGYILQKLKEQKTNSYGWTTESGESGSINPLYWVSCAKQGGRLITYGKKAQLTNVHANMLFFVQKRQK